MQSKKAADVPEATTQTAGRPVSNGPIDTSNMKFDQLYKLNKEIGSGNFAVVRAGTNKTTNEEVAIKCIKRSELSAEDEEALLTEAAVMKRLDHPNIVKFYGFYKEKHYFYIVMEMLRGGELFDRIVTKQYYSEKEARDVLRVLLDAIKYCHERDIVHRDLKPENLLLVSADDDSLLKVADFGFARELQSGALHTQCGTPGYVAPEILRGQAYGREVDMWSIGVITFILLGGYPPFYDESKAQLYKKIKRGKFEFNEKYWGNISMEARDLIVKLLTVDKTVRYTAEQALQHAWMKQDDATLAGKSLAVNHEQLKLFNARRKFQAGIRTVIITNRLSKLGALMSGGGDIARIVSDANTASVALIEENRAPAVAATA